MGSGKERGKLINAALKLSYVIFQVLSCVLIIHLIPQNRNVLGMLISPQLVKKFAFYDVKIRYHIHKNLPLIIIPSQMNQVHILSS
jgi:hypothetical protein